MEKTGRAGVGVHFKPTDPRCRDKPIKVVKALTGINSIYHVIEQSKRKARRHELLRSPERGLGHIIRERVPKPI